jgi:DNA polymerase elongation subunit (family B)
MADNLLPLRVFVVTITDSIFFTLPNPTPVPENPSDEWMQTRMIYVYEKAEEIAADITARLAEMYPPHCSLDMEFEGIMFPSLYLKKKNYRYIGRLRSCKM